jgi:hypothetical protein
MKCLKMLALASLTAAIVLGASGAALASTLTSPAGTALSKGAVIKSELTATAIFHPPIGDIECRKAGGEGEVTDAGSSTETAKGELFFGTFSECNAEVKVLTTGTVEVHTEGSSANGNGTLTGSGTEVTVVFSGFHCVFGTSNTDLGKVTGGTPATVQVNGTIPRIGGRSGVFCGSTAVMTAQFKVTSPATLLID